MLLGFIKHIASYFVAEENGSNLRQQIDGLAEAIQRLEQRTDRPSSPSLVEVNGIQYLHGDGGILIPIATPFAAASGGQIIQQGSLNSGIRPGTLFTLAPDGQIIPVELPGVTPGPKSVPSSGSKPAALLAIPPAAPSPDPSTPPVPPPPVPPGMDVDTLDDVKFTSNAFSGAEGRRIGWKFAPRTEVITEAEARRRESLAKPSNIANSISSFLLRSFNPSQTPLDGDNAMILASPWTGYPQGDFTLELTRDQYEKFVNMKSNWARLGSGGGGSITSLTWEHGSQYTEACLGVFVCKNPRCSVVVRPKYDKAARTRQKGMPCARSGCQGTLQHIECDVGTDARIRATTYRYDRDRRIRYVHEGWHSHPMPLPIHAMPAERSEMRDIALANRGVGPVGLVAGGPDRKPGGDISSVYGVPDRLAKERRQWLKSADPLFGSADAFAAFRDFQSKHPNFVRGEDSELGIISFQSQFMAELPFLEYDEDLPPIISVEVVAQQETSPPSQGLVTDGAHKYFGDAGVLLIMTSIYCRGIQAWAPSLMSRSMGQSEEFYAFHFFTLFRSMKEQADRRPDFKMNDEFFANVVDYSQAQRLGFIAAFIRYHLEIDIDGRSEAELRQAAIRLLKGCLYHFMVSVNRVARLKDVIPESRSAAFVDECRALTKVKSLADFQTRSTTLLHSYPAAESFLQWWFHRDRATMLFDAERVMDPDTAARLPDTTNSEESLHNTLYHVSGSRLTGLPALVGLWIFAEYFLRLYLASQSGRKIRYGKPAQWRLKSERYGTTHPSRLRASKKKTASRNDGRAFDTKAELVGRRKRKSPGKPTGDKITEGDSSSEDSGTSQSDSERDAEAKSRRKLVNAVYSPGFTWFRNSCWLDHGLLVLFEAIRPHYQDFRERFRGIPNDNIRRQFFKVIQGLLLVETNRIPETSIQEEFSNIRDGWRDIITAEGINLHQGTKFSQQSLWGWATGLINNPRVQPLRYSDGARNVKAQSFFQSHTIHYRTCTGGPEGPHIQLSRAPTSNTVFDMPVTDCKKFRGNVQSWFGDMVSDSGRHKSISCWWKDEYTGIELCEGTISEVVSVQVSLPVVLIFDVNAADISSKDAGIPRQWNFPEILRSSGSTELEYDIVGRIFYSKAKGHFIARFARRPSPDSDVEIYDYDDMNHDGQCVLQKRASVKKSLCGKEDSLRRFQAGFTTCSVIYTLRGGVKAQESFFNARLAVLKSEHGLNIPSPTLERRPSFEHLGDLTEMPTSARFWMKHPSSSIRDYHSGRIPDPSIVEGKPPMKPNPDVEEISSDDHTSRKPSSKMINPRRKPSDPIQKPPEVVEISSDDESSQKTSSPSKTSRTESKPNRPSKQAPTQRTIAKPARSSSRLDAKKVGPRRLEPPGSEPESEEGVDLRVPSLSSGPQASREDAILSQTAGKDGGTTSSRASPSPSLVLPPSSTATKPSVHWPPDEDLAILVGRGKRKSLDDNQNPDSILKRQRRSLLSTFFPSLSRPTIFNFAAPPPSEEAPVPDKIPGIVRMKGHGPPLETRDGVKILIAQHRKMFDDQWLEQQHEIPSSEKDINVDCRCGVKTWYTQAQVEELGQDLAYCQRCEHWTHQACAWGGYDPNSKDHQCERPLDYAERVQEPPDDSTQPLELRLKPGLGVLFQNGGFVYPARLIKRKSPRKEWTLNPWIGSVFLPSCEGQPGEWMDVPEKFVSDSHWRDREGRRITPLGRWQHPKDLSEANEDLVTDWYGIPYTETIDQALRPHLAALNLLFNADLNTLDPLDYPVMAWQLSKTGDRIHTIRTSYKLTPLFYARISNVDQAMIRRWLVENVQNGGARIYEIAAPAAQIITHCITLFIAHIERDQYTNLPACPSHHEQPAFTRFILKSAWDTQLSRSNEMVPHDVDSEAIELLEFRMFSRSKVAGVAGNDQWGLDIGDHQDGWRPYTDVDREEDLRVDYSDSELEPGPNFQPFNRDESLRVPPQPKPTRAQKRPQQPLEDVPKEGGVRRSSRKRKHEEVPEGRGVPQTNKSPKWKGWTEVNDREWKRRRPALYDNEQKLPL